MCLLFQITKILILLFFIKHFGFSGINQTEYIVIILCILPDFVF
jgi:hypothetical protein